MQRCWLTDSFQAAAAHGESSRGADVPDVWCILQGLLPRLILLSTVQPQFPDSPALHDSYTERKGTGSWLCTGLSWGRSKIQPQDTTCGKSKGAGPAACREGGSQGAEIMQRVQKRRAAPSPSTHHAWYVPMLGLPTWLTEGDKPI